MEVEVSDGIDSRRGQVTVATEEEDERAQLVIGGITVDPPVASRGGTVILSVTGVESDGEALTYTWSVPEGWSGSSDSDTLELVAPKEPGRTGVVRVQVTDGATVREVSAVVATAPNAAPVITTILADQSPVPRGGDGAGGGRGGRSGR